MTDADIIYRACERTEDRLRALYEEIEGHGGNASKIGAALSAIEILRVEIAAGLSAESR